MTAPGLREGRAVVLKANGGWCWFQDERAIVAAGQLIFGSVSGGGREAGDVCVSSVDLRTGAASSVTLHAGFECDDHVAPALLALSDGRILATYQPHQEPAAAVERDRIYWRTTVRPRDISAWTAEQSVSAGEPVSYSNLLRAPGDKGEILLFHRGRGFNPNYLVSRDEGATFAYGGRLLNWTWDPADPRATGLAGGGRPYAKYAASPDSSIHVVATQDHPRNYDNGLYHCILRGGRILGSGGAEIGRLSTDESTDIAPSDLTCIFGGGADHVPWVCDVHVDAAGCPTVVFSVQRDGARFRRGAGPAPVGLDHRYYYARWDGSAWSSRELCYAGSQLYAGEDDYTGLACIDPQDHGTVYVSTNADPATGAPLVSSADGRRHWEIFKGASKDGGTSWHWTAITENSTADNIRPIVPIGSEAAGRTIVLWLRGAYRTYRDYDLDVVGLVSPA